MDSSLDSKINNSTNTDTNANDTSYSEAMTIAAAVAEAKAYDNLNNTSTVGKYVVNSETGIDTSDMNKDDWGMIGYTLQSLDATTTTSIAMHQQQQKKQPYYPQNVLTNDEKMTSSSSLWGDSNILIANKTPNVPYDNKTVFVQVDTKSNSINDDNEQEIKTTFNNNCLVATDTTQNGDVFEQEISYKQKQEPVQQQQQLLLQYQWNDLYLIPTTAQSSEFIQQQKQHYASPIPNQQQQQQQQEGYGDSNCVDSINPCLLPNSTLDDTLSTPLLLPLADTENYTSSNNDNNDSSSDTTSSIWNNIRSIPNDIYNIHSYDDFILYIRPTVRYLGNYLAYCTLITMLMLVPTVLYNSLSNRKVMTAVINSAWIMVCGTVVLSMRLVYLHLTHWYMPQVQKYIVRILWMVPLYSIQSYLSLRHPTARVYITTIRDFYEAYVIANFVYYLIELLGGQEQILLILHSKDPAIYGHHAFPFNLVLDKWTLGIEFLIQCKHGVLQYVVFKTTVTVIVFICESFNVYGEGQFDWYVAYPYLSFVQNISVIYALYCLVLFFHVVNKELQTPINWHPLGKFLCIKGVVFFTWWQGLIIFILKDHGIIGPMGQWNSNQVANGLIDYCIVIEMIGFAIAHSYTFTYTEYLPSTIQQCYTEYEQLQQQQEQQQEQNHHHNHNHGHNDEHGNGSVYNGKTDEKNIESRYESSQFNQQTGLLSTQMQQSQLATKQTTQGDCVSDDETNRNTILNRMMNTNENTINHTNDHSSRMNDHPDRCRGTSNGSQQQQQQQSQQQKYRPPPATLPKPQSFKEALWSSTVPKETIKDIRLGLRAGVDGAIKFEVTNRERTASSQDMISVNSYISNHNDASSELLVHHQMQDGDAEKDRVIIDFTNQHMQQQQQQLQQEQQHQQQSNSDFFGNLFPDLLAVNDEQQLQQTKSSDNSCIENIDQHYDEHTKQT